MLPRVLPEVLADAARAAADTGSPERPAVIAFDGPAGSGKTTVGAAIGQLLGAEGTPVAMVHMDDLYPGWDGLAEAVPRLLSWVLEPLSTGRPARWRRYDWDTGAYAEWVDVPRTPVLVVEGVACGARPCAPHLALLVWVEAPIDLRYERGIARDGETFRPHWERWVAQEDVHFAEHDTRARADIVLTTEDGAPRLALDLPPG